MNKVLANIICAFVLSKRKRHKLRAKLLKKDKYKNIYQNDGKNNSIILVDPEGKESPCVGIIDGLWISIIGNNNKIKLHLPIKFIDTKIQIRNDNAEVEIGPSEGIFHLSIWMARGEGQKCFIGPKTTISGADITLTDCTSCHIGSECMFSHGIIIRGSDGHAIFNKETGECLNAPTKDQGHVHIGNHCWICENAVLLKKTWLPDNTIVSSGAIVTKNFSEEYTAIAGNPARVVSEKITWTPENPYEIQHHQKEKFGCNNKWER